MTADPYDSNKGGVSDADECADDNALCRQAIRAGLSVEEAREFACTPPADPRPEETR